MMLSGAKLIEAERERQERQKGYTPGHDDQFTQGELLAGANHIIYEVVMDRRDTAALHGLMVPCAQKVASKYRTDIISRLKIAGAFIAAEIDRLIRLQGNQLKPGQIPEEFTNPHQGGPGDAGEDPGNLHDSQEEIAMQGGSIVGMGPAVPVETDESIEKWIEQTFPGADPDSPRRSIRLLEEVIELCQACGATAAEIQQATIKATSGPGWCDGIADAGKIPIECADVRIALMGVTSPRKINLQRQVDLKMQVNRSRKWRCLGDGTGYHIKPGDTPPAEAEVPVLATTKCAHEISPTTRRCYICKKSQSEILAEQDRNRPKSEWE